MNTTTKSSKKQAKTTNFTSPVNVDKIRAQLNSRPRFKIHRDVKAHAMLTKESSHQKASVNDDGGKQPIAATSLDLSLDERQILGHLAKKWDTNAVTIPRSSAVLIPLCIHNGAPSILFIKRTSKRGSHRGQISFPGGIFDDGETHPVKCALREMNEEIGLVDGNVNIIGLHHDAGTSDSSKNIDTRLVKSTIITPVVGMIQHYSSQKCQQLNSDLQNGFNSVKCVIDENFNIANDDSKKDVCESENDQNDNSSTCLGNNNNKNGKSLLINIDNTSKDDIVNLIKYFKLSINELDYVFTIPIHDLIQFEKNWSVYRGRPSYIHKHTSIKNIILPNGINNIILPNGINNDSKQHGNDHIQYNGNNNVISNNQNNNIISNNQNNNIISDGQDNNNSNDNKRIIDDIRIDNNNHDNNNDNINPSKSIKKMTREHITQNGIFGGVIGKNTNGIEYIMVGLDQYDELLQSDVTFQKNKNPEHYLSTRMMIEQIKNNHNNNNNNNNHSNRINSNNNTDNNDNVVDFDQFNFAQLQYLDCLERQGIDTTTKMINNSNTIINNENFDKESKLFQHHNSNVNTGIIPISSLSLDQQQQQPQQQSPNNDNNNNIKVYIPNEELLWGATAHMTHIFLKQVIEPIYNDLFDMTLPKGM